MTGSAPNGALERPAGSHSLTAAAHRRRYSAAREVLAGAEQGGGGARSLIGVYSVWRL